MLNSATTFTAVSVASLAFASASFGAATYTNLGAGLTPYAVIDNGAVVAGTSSQFFYWTPGGGLVNVGGNPSAGTPELSNDGTKFCGNVIDGVSGWSEMAVYNIGTSTWTSLGSLGASSGSDASSAWGISGDGNVVVGLGWINAGSAHAIASTNGALPVDLGSTVVGSSTRANSCDFDGNTVVGWQDGNGRQGAIWVNGVQTKIFVDAAQSIPAGEAGDCDAAGTWVVGSASGQAYRWNSITGPSTGVELLGLAPAPGSPTWSGAATAISDDGSVIIGYYRAFGPPLFGRGFIWTQAGGMVDLTNYATAQGAKLGGATLALPLAISPDGRSIVGRTNTGSGFLVVIAEPCVADVNGDNTVGVADLLTVIAAWGPCANPSNCPADVNNDDVVGVADLLTVIAAWGACP